MFCRGAIGILDHSTKVASWKKALGALVIAHESYHLSAHMAHPDSEALTECRAIRATAGTIRLLGGDEATVKELMPFALAIHWRLSAKYPDYFFKSCRVPWWWK